MQHQSSYDPSRPTVGAIYRDAQISNAGDQPLVGDLAHEMTKSLVDDLNKTIESNPFDGNPFYITVHESKDLQMKRCIKRRIIKTPYRPWPEDDTVVFWVDPKSNDVRYCWCLPHWSEMYNVLLSFGLYEDEYIRDINAWKAFDLYHFGFVKDDMGKWMANPKWQDKKLETTNA